MVSFTPRLIPAILPNLAHHVPMIQSAAIRTNKLLLSVIQNLPSPADVSSRPIANKQTSSQVPRSPTPTPAATSTRRSTVSKDSSRDVSSPELALESPSASVQRSRGSTLDVSMTPRPGPNIEMPPPPVPTAGSSRPHSPASLISQTGNTSKPPEEHDHFDYQATVNELTIQFLSEFEETRVAALKWLIMLHQKAPKKVRHLSASSITLF